MKLGDSTKLKVIDRVSEVFSAAVDDGLIGRNPLYAKSVQRPDPHKHEAIPLMLDQLDALSLALRHSPGCAEDCETCGPSRYEILPYLGAATGERQGEMSRSARHGACPQSDRAVLRTGRPRTRGSVSRRRCALIVPLG
jgi:hypothetical protein